MNEENYHERDEEYERQRRMHNLRDRDRRTHQKREGCVIQAMLGLLLLAGLLFLLF